MNTHRKIGTILLLLICAAVTSTSIAQSKAELEQLVATPKTAKTFPLNYKIALPDPDSCTFGYHMNRYEQYLTPSLIKTQQSLSGMVDGVATIVWFNSIRPHAQLDTATIINDPRALAGTWRMLTYRSVNFNDSLDYIGKKCYHLDDQLLDDKSKDEALAVFTDKQFTLYVKEAGKTHFKKMGSSKYQVENRRFLMLYKFFKAGAGVSQMGIDENGYLILNYPKVVMREKKNSYMSYNSVIEQYIFERVKQ